MTDPVMARLGVSAVVLSDVGRVRSVNEDCARFVNPEGSGTLGGAGVLALVADGMGGLDAGDVASRLAVEVIARNYFAATETPGEALRRSFETANHELLERSAGEMGTTCTALALRDGVAYAAHIGDTRIYLLRDGDIFQMTEDDSVVMEMVNQGLIDSAEARQRTDRNVIIQALGTREEIEVFTWSAPLGLRVGDVFILSTDGLHDLVELEEIRAAALGAEPRAAGESLVELANARGGPDNITVCIVTLDEGRDARPVPVTREAPVAR